MSEGKEVGGDWAVKGLDFDTYLVGAVTDKIIDADRLARRELRNGFPNWALYRTILCGDHHLRTQLRDWCVSFAIAAAESGVIRAGLPAEEMGCLAGWDAYYRLNNLRWLIAGHDVADVAGVDPKTYRKLRNYVYATNNAALHAYFVELQIAIRRVWKRDRFTEADAPANVWRPVTNFEESPYERARTDGSGNYWARPTQAGDS